MKICFFGSLSSTFIKNDYEILKKHFEIDLVQPPNKKKEWIKYPSLVKKKSKHLMLSLGGSQDGIPPQQFIRLKDTEKRAQLLLGDMTLLIPQEINYGAFTNLKEKIPAKYVLKNVDLALPVSEFTKMSF